MPKGNFIVDFYDSFRGFIDLKYPDKIYSEWREKDFGFLYYQIRLPTSYSRAALALAILSDRKDTRILPILKKSIGAEIPEINRSLVLSLINYGTEQAAPTLMKIVNKYKDLSFKSEDKKNWDKFDIYSEALEGLSLLHYEPVFPIIKKMAQYGSGMERNTALMRLLYHYKNHWEDIAPLYYDALLNNSTRINVLIFKDLESPEAIPFIEEYAQKNPLYRDRAEDTINYLKTLQANQQKEKENKI